MTILEILRNTSANNRANRPQLSYLTGMSDRAVRKEIHDLRQKGHWIVGDTTGGGYYLSSAKEWDAFCDQQRRRAINNFYRKSFESKVMEGQIGIMLLLEEGKQ